MRANLDLTWGRENIHSRPWPWRQCIWLSSAKVFPRLHSVVVSPPQCIPFVGRSSRYFFSLLFNHNNCVVGDRSVLEADIISPSTWLEWWLHFSERGLLCADLPTKWKITVVIISILVWCCFKSNNNDVEVEEEFILHFPNEEKKHDWDNCSWMLFWGHHDLGYVGNCVYFQSFW